MKGLDREEIIEVLQDELEGIMDDVSDTYESNDSPEGEDLEYKARSGFSPHTDGGYKYTFLSFAKHLEGAGIDLPTKVLQDRVDEFSKNADEHAQSEIWNDNKDDEFRDEFPTKEDVNYSDLEDFDSEYAEEFNEIVREYRDDESILFSIEAMYYKPENDNGEDGKNTITLSGSVNLETPYHRRGFYEDFKEITFTFSSLESLEKKLRNELEVIKSWFDGSDYKTSTTELKQGRLENGGKVYGSSYQDEVEDRVRDLTEQEYEVFAFDNKIDPEDANEMSDFISDLDQDEANKIILQLRGEDYAKGGEIGWKSMDDRKLESLNETAIHFFNKLSEKGKEQYKQELMRLKKAHPYKSGTENWTMVVNQMNGFDEEYGEGTLSMRRNISASEYRYGLQIMALESSMKDNGLKEYAKGGKIKTFLCVEDGDEFTIEASNLAEAESDCEMWNAQVIREINPNELEEENDQPMMEVDENDYREYEWTDEGYRRKDGKGKYAKGGKTDDMLSFDKMFAPKSSQEEFEEGEFFIEVEVYREDEEDTDLIDKSEEPEIENFTLSPYEITEEGFKLKNDKYIISKEDFAEGLYYQFENEYPVHFFKLLEISSPGGEKIDVKDLQYYMPSPDNMKFAKGGKLEVGKNYGAKFSNKFNKRVPTDFKVVRKFKGRDDISMVEIITENGVRANMSEKDLKPLMFAKGGTTDKWNEGEVKDKDYYYGYEIEIWGKQPEEGDSEDRRVGFEDTYSDAMKVLNEHHQDLKKGEDIVIRLSKYRDLLNDYGEEIRYTRHYKEDKNYAKGGKVEKKGNEMIMGGLAGILFGFLLNK